VRDWARLAGGLFLEIRLRGDRHLDDSRIEVPSSGSSLFVCE
jgi:hypothetical protein